MKKSRINVTVSLLLWSAALLSTTSCTRNSRNLMGGVVGNPGAAITIEKFNLTGPAGGTGSLVICSKSLTLTGSSGTSKVDIAHPVERVVPTEGATLEAMQIPLGTYSEMTLDLDDSCGTGRSLQVINSNGTFQTSGPISLKIVGTLTGKLAKVHLFIQPIATDLALVTQDSEVVSRATTSAGQFVAETFVSQSQMTVVSETGSEPLVYPARLAIDGDPDTRWYHSGSSAEVVLNLGGSYNVTGFRYTEFWTRIASYELYVSVNGSTWGSPVSSGAMPADGVIEFTGSTGGFVKFRGISGAMGYFFTQELNVLKQ